MTVASNDEAPGAADDETNDAKIERYETALRKIGTPAHVPHGYSAIEWWQHTACKRAQTAREALGINAETLIREARTDDAA